MARGRAVRTVVIVIGSLAVVLLLLFCPNPWAAHEESDTYTCVTRQRALAEALSLYAAENGDRLPPSGTWTVAITGYLKGDCSGLSCPSRSTAGEATYAIRGGRKLSDSLAGVNQLLLYEVRGEVPAFPHRTYPRSLWGYPAWRQGKPGLSRRPDAYMWVTYDDGHYAAKSQLPQEMLSTGYDPDPF